MPLSDRELDLIELRGFDAARALPLKDRDAALDAYSEGMNQGMLMGFFVVLESYIHQGLPRERTAPSPWIFPTKKEADERITQLGGVRSDGYTRQVLAVTTRDRARRLLSLMDDQPRWADAKAPRA
ncbi:hypothetical protein [Miltoncostaea oceani]|uniref:hypothetical protein n=1 Tax=Miltoncostaea oceani TaxID=2843216 RepID=UPI001C3D8D98|nr:hypothetical protein [Miltoncostaea oceani]